MSIRVSSKVSSPAPRVQEASSPKAPAQAKATTAAPPPARQARPSVDVFESTPRRAQSLGDSFEASKPQMKMSLAPAAARHMNKLSKDGHGHDDDGNETNLS